MSDTSNDQQTLEQTFVPVARMSRDTAKAAATLSDTEARYIVNLYYMMQEKRKRSSSQQRYLAEQKAPNSVFLYFADQDATLEAQAKRALDYYTNAHPMGRWCRSHVGVGPVLAAGLLAHIKIEESPTVSHIWRYAGLDSTVKWIGAEGAKTLIKSLFTEHGKNLPHAELVAHACQAVNRRQENYYKALERNEKESSTAELTAWLSKRPWNADLKVLCWKLGESWVKFSNHEDCFYGHYYAKRKAYETAKNNNLEYADQAKIGAAKVGKDTEAYKSYAIGKLPPAHIHARSQRWATKLFLAHLHGAWYEQHFQKPPPLPYPIQYLGHAHVIEPPAITIA